MKYLKLLLLLTALNSFGQEFPSYNAIMEIEPHHIPNDYQIYNVDPEIIKTAGLRQDFVSGTDKYKTESLVILTTNGHLVEKESRRTFAGAGMFDFSIIKKFKYDKNKLIAVELFKDENTSVNEGTKYSYFEDGTISKVTTYIKDEEKVINYKQLTNNQSQKEANDLMTIYSYEIIPNDDKRIHKIETNNKTRNQKYLTEYLYQDERKVIGKGTSGQVDYTILTKITKKTSGQTTEYFLDTEGGKKIQKKITTNFKTNKTYTDTYYYKFDENGVWIIKYIDKDGYNLGGNLPEIQIREIAYAHGDITGSIDPESELVKQGLKEIKQQIFWNSNKGTTTPAGTVWTKNDDGSSYGLFIDRKGIANQCKSYFVENDLIVFHPETKTLYKLQDFKTKSPNTHHEGLIHLENIDNGFGFKMENGNYKLFNENGVEYQYNEVFAKYDYDGGGNFISTKKDGVKLVLENAKNYDNYVVYPIVPFDVSKHNIALISSGSKSLTDSIDAVVDVLDGECVKGDCQNGYGEKKWKSGKLVEAFFKDGKPQGPGVITYEDASQKFAYFQNDWKTTKGFVYTFYKKDGVSEFFNLKTGVAFSSNINKPEIYSADLNKGTKTLIQQNNDANCFYGDCQNGVGVYQYNNKALYVGTFKNGNRHGFGELSYPNGNSYVGEFSNGKKEGLGSYAWSETNYYTGEYKNDTYHGIGKMAFNNGTYQAGIWQNGEYVNSLDGIQYQPETQNAINNLEVDSKIFESVKSYVESVKGDNGYLAKIIDNDYRNLQKTLSGDELYKETSKYFVALYKIDPKLVFSVFMKWNDSESLVPIKAQLPKEINDNLKLQAQGVMDGYNKYINSKETQDKIKEHGGGFKKVKNN